MFLWLTLRPVRCRYLGRLEEVGKRLGVTTPQPFFHFARAGAA